MTLDFLSPTMAQVYIVPRIKLHGTECVCEYLFVD